LTWAPGDRVVIPEREFSSTAFPWLNLRDRGVVVDEVPVASLAEAVRSSRPRLVAFSWVQAFDGMRIDAEAIAGAAHEAGAWCVVDAIQGVGVLPADLAAWGVDAACADGHKWLLGPNSAGIAFVAPALRDALRVAAPGWMSVSADAAADLRLEWQPSGRRYEGGSPNFIGIHGLGAALDLIREVGVDAIWQHVRGLAAQLAGALRAAGATVAGEPGGEHGSAIVAATFPSRSSVELVAAALARDVVVAERRGAVRIAPAGFTTVEDIDRALDVLAGS
jgi:selenocysteine lyase/cysteine desulfurase